MKMFIQYIGSRFVFLFFRVIKAGQEKLRVFAVMAMMFAGVTSMQANAPGGVANNLHLWLKANANAYNTGATQATDGQRIDAWLGVNPSSIRRLFLIKGII